MWCNDIIIAGFTLEDITTMNLFIFIKLICSLMQNIYVPSLRSV